jgi:hypothetical protein
MTGPDSDLRTTTLHAVRLLGFAPTHRVAARCGSRHDVVEEVLLDLEAYGWVTRSRFASTQGWSLTERGRAQDERRVGEELDRLAARPTVTAVHQRFLPLNARFQEAVTRWQIRPLPGDAMAVNDHSDHRWDDRVLDSLSSLGRRLVPLQTELSSVLARFDGYAERYVAALGRATGGDHRWVDAVGVDSCHVVWMQLHEDLLATLGLDRADGA